tara:strand:+ start:1762 stop:3309 length:1548 start_codon:yes stop_codon:yes gene_type:complete
MGTAEARYRSLETFRQTFLDRARDCSELTIPSLIPPDIHTATSDLYQPYQGIGARGVNNLASKLSLALMPPNAPFFRFMVEPYSLKELADDPDARTDVEKQLGEYERAVMSEIETSGDRVAVHEALKHLIVGGNVLLHIGPERTRVIHLDSYVVSREPNGDVMEVVIVETVSPNALDKATAAKIQGKLEGDEKTVEIYTHIERKNEMFDVYQEVKGEVVANSRGKFRADAVPFLPLRFSRIDGEDYGRGFVEELLGDLRSLEGLSQAIVEGSAAAAKTLFLVNPNGTTRMKSIAAAENTAIIEGNASDVSVLQMDKFNDFRVAYQAMQGIEERLSQQFMLQSSVQRNGERVTAEEIRYLASELEDTLSGIYSILSQEFQLPYVNRKTDVLTKAKKLPKLPENIVKPTIVTGMEALGRGHDLRKLDLFIQGMTQALGPEVLQQYVNLQDYIKRRATALGIETEGLIKTEEQIAQEMQQMQLQQMAMQAGPNAIQEGVKALGNSYVEAQRQEANEEG